MVFGVSNYDHDKEKRLTATLDLVLCVTPAVHFCNDRQRICRLLSGKEKRTVALSIEFMCRSKSGRQMFASVS